MASSILDVTSAQIEAVEKNLPKLYGSSNSLASKIKATSKVQKVNRQLYRIPIELYPGGAFAKFIANGGSLGSGHSFKTSHLTAAYFYSRQAHRLTLEQMDTTSDASMSVVNAFSHEMASALETAEEMDDISLHNDGTGWLTEDSSAKPSTTTLTFNAAADMLKVHRLREGMAVDVWASDDTTLRAGGPYYITAIDWVNKIVTFNAAVTGLTSGDRLSFANLDVYGPAALTSFSSTFPSGALTDADGIGGDSFRHGIYYSNDATAANYFLGVLKSTVPQLLAVAVSGASSALTPSHVIQVIHGIQQKRPSADNAGLVGIFHLKQAEAMMNYSMSLVQLNRGASFGQIYDPVPSNKGYKDSFSFAGYTCVKSTRQYLDRVDFINPSNWGRAEARPLGFFSFPGGSKVFEGRTGDGEVAAYLDFFVVGAYDWVDMDAGSTGYIHTLEVPS